MVVLAPWEVTGAFSAAGGLERASPSPTRQPTQAELSDKRHAGPRAAGWKWLPRHAAGERLGGGARLMNAIALPDKGDDFLSRSRAEVVGSASPIESSAPSFGEFCNAFGQPLDFAVVIR
jgi:hypothetical protein